MHIAGTYISMHLYMQCLANGIFHTENLLSCYMENIDRKILAYIDAYTNTRNILAWNIIR